MIGQAISNKNKKYNVIILAGGLGTRMGMASEYIPKALTKIGNLRAIDYIIERYRMVAHQFIIGTGWQADLLMAYVKGKYPNCVFSYEDPQQLKNNGVSAMYCLDHADSHYGTIITFCDLIMMDNLLLVDDSLYYVTENTKGTPGTFRHSVYLEDGLVDYFGVNPEPAAAKNGVLGTFVLSDTPLLKSIIYGTYANSTLRDLTEDVLTEYNRRKKLQAQECKAVYEFGTESDLKKMRERWENA